MAQPIGQIGDVNLGLSGMWNPQDVAARQANAVQWPVGDRDPNYSDTVVIINWQRFDGLWPYNAAATTQAFVGSSGAPFVVNTRPRVVMPPIPLFGGPVANFQGLSGTGTANEKLFTLPNVGTGPFTFGTADFTLEGWFLLNSATSIGWFMDWRTSAGDGAVVAAISMNNAQIVYRVSGINQIASGPYPAILTAWHHLAIVRASSVTKMYIDGVQYGSVADSGNYSSSNQFTIGNTGNSSSGLNPLQGYVGPLRVTKNVARYTAPFTPPTTYFPES